MSAKPPGPAHWAGIELASGSACAYLWPHGISADFDRADDISLLLRETFDRSPRLPAWRLTVPPG